MPAPELMHMFRRLIEIPSISSVSPAHDMSNKAIIDEFAGWCEDAGFAVEVIPVPNASGKYNLLASRGHGDDGGMVLSGHTDTVPCDPQLWSSDPFTLSERNGRLHGLGICDMKSFLAIALEAMRPVRDKDLARPLTIVATADEESTMAGARALATSGRNLGRFALIGEPTNLRPVRMHKGIMMLAISVTGRSGHSSDPDLGRNALEGMHRVIGRLLDWRQQLQSRHHNPLFAVPVPTLNLGHIHGGDNPNRICGRCELHIDLRLLPGMDSAGLLQDLESHVAAALAGTGLQHELRRLFSGIEPMETPADSTLIRTAEEITGLSAGAEAYGTEAPFFQSMGMEVLIMGPGDIRQAHQPDEFLAVERIEPAIDAVRLLVRTFCMH